MRVWSEACSGNGIDSERMMSTIHEIGAGSAIGNRGGDDPKGSTTSTNKKTDKIAYVRPDSRLAGMLGMEGLAKAPSRGTLARVMIPILIVFLVVLVLDIAQIHNGIQNRAMVQSRRSRALFDSNSGDSISSEIDHTSSEISRLRPHRKNSADPDSESTDSVFDAEVTEMLSREPTAEQIEEREFYNKLKLSGQQRERNHEERFREIQIKPERDLKRPVPLDKSKPATHDFAAPTSSFANLQDMSDEELFENYQAMSKAPVITISGSGSVAKKYWWGTSAYMKLYTSHPIKKLVPVLRAGVQLNMQSFTQRFRKLGQPVLFRGSNLARVGFKMQGYEMEELRVMFPVAAHVATESKKSAFKQYRPNARVDDSEIDLGPGLAAIADDGDLVRKNGLRNFPRNMKVKTEALKKLGAQWPPLVPSRWRQRPSLWMGTSSSGTAFHSDCCDNFIVMVAGTKRITLAPPTDFQALQPRCVGANKGLCYANIPEPNKPGVSSSHYHKMIVDVKPGEILYVPAGWFHHIENLGGTVMYNCWTFGAETSKVAS